MEHEGQSSEARFVAYVDALSAVLGREDRAQPLKDYCTGLLMPGERKSVEPMAAVVAPFSCVGETSIAAAFGGPGGLVGHSGSGQGPGTRRSGDRSARRDRGLDCR